MLLYLEIKEQLDDLVLTIMWVSTVWVLAVCMEVSDKIDRQFERLQVEWQYEWDVQISY